MKNVKRKNHLSKFQFSIPHYFKVTLVITLCFLNIGILPAFAHEDEDEGPIDFYEALSGSSAVGQNGNLEEQYETSFQKLQSNRAEQDRLRSLIYDTQSRERNLEGQIAYLDARARLKELQIAETETIIIETQDQLVSLSGDIESLQIKAGILGESIGRLQDAYFARVRSSYESSFTPTLSVFLAEESFQSAVLKYAYLKNLREEDNKFLTDLKGTRTQYQDRQNQLTELKGQKEQLKVDLEGQKKLLEEQTVQLEQEKQSKAYLLQLTSSEEYQYQKLLEVAQQEQRAIEDALNKVLQQITGRVLEGTRVYRGDLIGVQGSTGFSTGEHLHFGYYPCGGWSCSADPMGLLNSGSFTWPLSNFEISQGFGLTSFALTGVYGYDAYGNPKGHNGVDMVGPSGSAIKASHDGTIYYTVDGWGGHGAILIDDAGFMTIYWHLQAR